MFRVGANSPVLCPDQFADYTEQAKEAILARDWDRLTRDGCAALLDAATAVRRIGSQETRPVTTHSHQDLLAATLGLALTEPLTWPLTPYLFTDLFYVGDRDDAAEFVVRVLHRDQTPGLWALRHGRWEQYLRCRATGCGHRRLSEGEDFGALFLPLTPKGVVVASVQEAVDEYLPDEDVEFDDKPCQRCGAVGVFCKEHEFTRLPPVLILFLNRWTGPSASEAILTPIETTVELRFKGRDYRLRSVVAHLGPTPSAGHYVTVARHDTSHDVWWLYDDDRRVMATEEQRATTCEYRGWGPMQSYMVVYEAA